MDFILYEIKGKSEGMQDTELSKIFTDLEIHEIQVLLTKMRSINSEIAKYTIGDSPSDVFHIAPNSMTIDFIQNGAFRSLIGDKIEKLKFEQQERELNLTLAESNINANKAQLRMAKFNRKWVIINSIISLVNILLALYTVWQHSNE